MSSVTLDISQFLHLTDDQFFQLCQLNPNAKLERTATGEIVVMSPTGGDTGNRNFNILGQKFERAYSTFLQHKRWGYSLQLRNNIF